MDQSIMTGIATISDFTVLVDGLVSTPLSIQQTVGQATGVANKVPGTVTLEVVRIHAGQIITVSYAKSHVAAQNLASLVGPMADQLPIMAVNTVALRMMSAA